MVILENINIDIDKAILQNIDIDKISNRFKFGISNRATVTQLSISEYLIGLFSRLNISERIVVHYPGVFNNIIFRLMSTRN